MTIKLVYTKKGGNVIESLCLFAIQNLRKPDEPDFFF